MSYDDINTMSCVAEIELIPWILTFVLCLLIGVEVCTIVG